MGTNEGTNFSNRQIPYGFVVVLAQELRIRMRHKSVDELNGQIQKDFAFRIGNDLSNQLEWDS